MIGGTQREGETEDPRRILTIYKEARLLVYTGGQFYSWRVVVWSSKGDPGGADTLKDLEVTDNFRDNENTNKSTHKEVEGGGGSLRPGNPLF